MDKLKTLYDTNLPILKSKIRKRKPVHKPWITKGFLVSLKAKNKLYKQFLKNPSITNEEKYKKMTWKTHINFITNKISKLSGIIARLRHYVGIKILRDIYFTLIYPYITYCNIVWGSNYSSRLQNLHKVQKKNNSFNHKLQL